MICPPLGGAERRGHAQCPAFAPSSSEVAVGFLIFLYLVVHNLPQLCMHAAIFSPFQFLCIFLLEEMFVQVQALQQRVPGHRSQPVSDLIEPKGTFGSGEVCSVFWGSFCK